MVGKVEPSSFNITAARALSLAVTVFIFALPIGIGGAPAVLDDGDVSWHVAAGQWMLAHHAIPKTDPFSFTAFGHPWVAMEWLSELIYASAYNIAGYSGLAAAVAGAFVALHAIFFSYLRRRVGPFAIAVAVIAADLVLIPFILARPHVLVWPIIAGWSALLLRSLDTQQLPPWWSLLLPVAWTNMHGSFPLALVIAGGVAIDAVLEAKATNWRAWALFLTATMMALLLNANGLRGVLQPIRVAELKMLPTILEWQPSTPALTPLFYVVLLLWLAAMLWRGVRVPPGRMLVLLVLLELAFQQVRQQSWFIIFLALAVPGLFGTGGTIREPIRPFLVAALFLLIIRASIPIRPIEDAAHPDDLIAVIPPELRSRAVFNGYSLGGPLILAGIHPYIDGRADMYGDAFYADYLTISAGDMERFNRAVSRYDIRWVILPYSDARLIKALGNSISWRRIRADKVGVIYVRLD